MSNTPVDASAQAASDESGDPWLLTPGPLTTSLSVKRAMLRDLGSRDREFIAVTQRIRESLLGLVDGHGSHECVPVQGSGTFAVEAMIGTFVPADGKLLILVNGAYGKRIARICEYLGRNHQIIETPEYRSVDVLGLDKALTADTDISHVAVVHCETTTGIINPLGAVADVVASHCRGLLVDAMSSFGAIPIDARRVSFDALAASSNKCLQGVPGVGFCIARRDALQKTQANSPSLCLDLHDQWQAMAGNSQWRFTPPTHCLLALDQALEELMAEGGVAGRGARYRQNHRLLVDGMRQLGFETLLADGLQAPIIVTFLSPADARFEFGTFYERLRQRGFVIYPGKLTLADTFRVGCIGHLGETQITAALAAIREVLDELGVEDCAPARGRAA
jgi:2-aminoethylphosphonate-pyruvate transaminase